MFFQIEITTKAAPVEVPVHKAAPVEVSVHKAAPVPEPVPLPEVVPQPVLPAESIQIEGIAREPRTQAVANCDLKKVLKEHPLGPSILDNYRAKGLLDNVCQSYLCEIIALYFLKCCKS